MNTFWMVWNPAGRAPVFKHESAESAKNEAKRLAELNIGQNFIVLQSIGEASIEKPKATFVAHSGQEDRAVDFSQVVDGTPVRLRNGKRTHFKNRRDCLYCQLNNSYLYFDSGGRFIGDNRDFDIVEILS